ncbi:MAG: tetratricopeptide repeat protein [Verrucomicrobiota bacterium]
MTRSTFSRRLAVITLPCLTAVALAGTLPAQEVRRAIPLEPPTPPAVPFDSPRPVAPAAAPVATATPTPKPPVPEAITAAPTPASPSASAKSPDVILIDYANNFYSRKVYDTAAPEYEKYLSTYPNGADRQAAQFRLGECYRALGDINSAKLAYQTLLDNFGVGEFIGPAAYRLAELYLEEKDYSDAENNFRKASVRVRDPLLSNAARFYMARCLENLSRTSEARSVYEDLGAVKEGNPFRDASLISLSRLLAGSNRKAEALKPLEVVATTTENPQLKAEATVKAALLKIDLNQPDKATADLTRALKMPEIGQWKEIAQIGLLRVLYETGKYKPLIDQYNATANDYTAESKPEVILLAANSYRQLGQQDPARQMYELVMHDYPGTVFAKEAQYERLVSLYTANDPALTKEADDYLTQNPDPVKRDQVVLLKAEALYKRQDYAGAAPIYACIGSTRLMPAYKAEALFKLGWCYMQLKDIDHATTAYTDFLDLYPTHKLIPSALAQRAIAYQQAKNFGAALRDFNTLITRYPGAKEREFALQQKALTLGQQQDSAGMAETFKQLLREYPKSPAAAQANYWIGWAAFEAKDYKNSIAPLEAASKADREQFFERATQRVMLAYYCLEDREALASAVDGYVKAVGKGKVPAEILRWLGTSFVSDKAYDRGEKYLTLLVARQGEVVVDDRLNLGRSQLRQGKYDEAVKTMRIYLEQVKQPFPRATGLLGMGEAQLGLSQYDDAKKSADEACSLQPEGRVNAEGLMLSGDILMAQQQYEEAARIYQKVALVFDDQEVTPQALEKACIALKTAGKAPEAAKVLNTLQSKYPEYQVKQAARK